MASLTARRAPVNHRAADGCRAPGRRARSSGTYPPRPIDSLTNGSIDSSTPPRTSVTQSRRWRRIRSTPPCRVDELMAHELHAPWSWTSTTPVATSADTRTRSPPSACTAGRIRSMMATRAARRSPRSSSLNVAGAVPPVSGAPPVVSAAVLSVSTSSVLPPVRTTGPAGPAAPLPHSLPCRPGRPCTAVVGRPSGTGTGLRSGSGGDPSPEGAGVPCGVAPVRPSEPLGAVGLILPTFVQHTVPTWARPSTGTRPDGDPLAELADLCRRAEQAGAGALWACDHLFWHGPCLECMVVLTVAATATERAALGSCVIQLPLRRAVAVAKQASTLQTLSRGRLVLGVGVGSHPGEYEQVGAGYHRRGHDLDTGIGELHRAWGSAPGPSGATPRRPTPPSATASCPRPPRCPSGSAGPRRPRCAGPPTSPTAGCRSS